MKFVSLITNRDVTVFINPETVLHVMASSESSEGPLSVVGIIGDQEAFWLVKGNPQVIAQAIEQAANHNP